MTTAAIMTAIETILLTTKDVSNNNYFTSTAEVKAVDMGSYQVLDKGVEYAAVLLPGRFRSDEPASYSDANHDDILVDLFARYGSDAATNWDNFTAFRDAVRAKLQSYPTLNGVTGVHKVSVIADEDPGAVLKGTGKSAQTGPIFIVQRLRVTVVQTVVLDAGEYA